MLPPRPQAFEVAPDGDAEAAGADAAHLKVDENARNIPHPKVVQHQRAQHVIVIGCGDVAQIMVADLFRHFLPRVFHPPLPVDFFQVELLDKFVLNCAAGQNADEDIARALKAKKFTRNSSKSAAAT